MQHCCSYGQGRGSDPVLKGPGQTCTFLKVKGLVEVESTEIVLLFIFFVCLFFLETGFLM